MLLWDKNSCKNFNKESTSYKDINYQTFCKLIQIFSECFKSSHALLYNKPWNIFTSNSIVSG